MERRIGSLRAEVIDPESAKFTAPLLLLHGLWSTPAIWRSFTGYLAHRGWLSVAPFLQDAGYTSLAAHVAAVDELIAALPSPPVIIGHDLGALIALQTRAVPAAVVALAPLVLPPLVPPPRALFEAESWLERLTGSERPRRAPRGRWRASYPSANKALVEPAALLRELTGRGSEIPARSDDVPRLVVAGEADVVSSPDQVRTLATRIGAEFRTERSAGHALLVDAGWDQRVSAVHRWIVQAVGKRLLALFDESFEE